MLVGNDALNPNELKNTSLLSLPKSQNEYKPLIQTNIQMPMLPDADAQVSNHLYP
jgi:hypothetical protein